MAFLVSNTMTSPALMVLLCCFLLIANGAHQSEACYGTNQKLQSLQVSVPANQPYLTSYHFRPPQNWINGPMYYKGVYHLFYQYNPLGPLFGDKMIWAHSVSYDLINWIHLSHALCPSGPYDINSCWSGSVTILPGDKPFILYTGIDASGQQVQNLAMPENLSDPLLKDWVKFSGNPVMTPPNGVKDDMFRDPTTAWQGPDGRWRVVVGGQIDNEGMAFVYWSWDFIHWTKLDHPLYSVQETGMWECPDFFPVSINGTIGVDTSVLNPGVKHVLKTSLFSDKHDYYVLGTYDPQMDIFSPDTDFHGNSNDLRYDYGKFYASKTFFDSAKNRRVLWAWANESDSTQDDIDKGWSGVQTVPRAIWLDKSGKQLVQWPVEEIETLRGKQVSIHDKELGSGSIVEVSGITASQVDVEIDFELPELEEAELFDPAWLDPQQLCNDKNASIQGRFGPFGLLILATEDLTEKTAIFFRIFKGQNKYVVLMCSDHSRSSLKEDLDKTTYGAFVDIDPHHGKVSLRSLVDHSIVESFAARGKTCITTRVYPKVAVENEAHLFAFNNGTQSVVISSLNAWNMNQARLSEEESFKL
ncbi:hypothetical protein AB3S75_016639 [Citrus x aurantiifolia]